MTRSSTVADAASAINLSVVHVTGREPPWSAVLTVPVHSQGHMLGLGYRHMCSSHRQFGGMGMFWRIGRYRLCELCAIIQ